MDDDIHDAIYKALDRLQELDPTSVDEPWFKLTEKAARDTLPFERVEPTMR